MKNLHHITSALALALALTFSAQAQSSSFTIPSDWQESDNWILPYHQQIGNHASASWLTDLMDEDATMLTHKDNKGFIIIREESPEGFTDLRDWAEEPLAIGNGDQFLLGSQRSLPLDRGYTSQSTGTLSGRSVTIQRTYLLNPENDVLISILAVSAAQENNRQFLPQASEEVAQSIAFKTKPNLQVPSLDKEVKFINSPLTNGGWIGQK